MTVASFKKYGKYHHHRTSMGVLLQLEGWANPVGFDTLRLYHQLQVSALPKHLQKRGGAVKTNLALKLRAAGFVGANSLQLSKRHFNAIGDALYCSEEDERGVLKTTWIDMGDCLESCSFAYNCKQIEGKAAVSEGEV